MFNSKSINSPQVGPHKNLAKIIDKHIHTAYQKPYREHNINAFENMLLAIKNHGANKLILDSCCGTGLSSMIHAQNNPDALVIGIDQSIKRLNKESDFFEEQPNNCFLLQANCEDIWRLCVSNDIVFERHYILYPNPYPKPEHFKRRWHGHPVFPNLNVLACKTELRSNWQTYLDEFQLSWQQLTGNKSEVEELRITSPLTLFERKYSASGQTLYKLEVKSCIDKKI